MITGIQKIKMLGVYADYARPAGTQNFALKNLIYGWNYSGKTTLSRLFALLEAKQVNPDLASCSFTFDTENGPITETNFAQSALNVRVFNSDFVARNLNFSGEDFNPILLLGKESEDAQKKLDHFEIISTKVKERIVGIRRDIQSSVNDYSEAKTKTAAKIKKDIGRVEAYTSVHLDKDIFNIEILKESKTLTDDQLKIDLKLALTSDQERPQIVDQIAASASIFEYYVDAKALMALTPSLASTIEHLVKNPIVEKWVDTGLRLHSEKEKCEFCGSELSHSRLVELQAHFSKDLADHKLKVEQILKRVEQAKITISLPKEAELNAQFREKYLLAINGLKDPLKDYNMAMDILMGDLQKKIATPFEALEPSQLQEGLDESVINAISAINTVISDNNTIANNFTAAKREALERVRLHYVQEFLDTQNIDSYQKAITHLKRSKDRFNRFSEAVRNEILRLKAVISRAQLGREEINQRLNTLLGSQGVQIDVVNIAGQDRFQLVRNNGGVAKNLSDGERTAIAFAYFLTKLKELTPEIFKETIVYIDDPVSSLDSNHIFQITAIINETFFVQVQDGGPWTTKCKQIFISTHNFEFFHLMRELDPKSKTTARLYLVRRVKHKESTISDMPKSLSLFSSEYHFLFDIIHRFHKAPDKTEPEVLVLLPNAVRRFVELYTYSRIPGQFKSSVDQRADELFGKEKAKRIMKVFHYFSHANSFDRLAGFNDLIFETENAVNDLFEAIRATDEKHMNALEASIAP